MSRHSEQNRDSGLSVDELGSARCFDSSYPHTRNNLATPSPLLTVSTSVIINEGPHHGEHMQMHYNYVFAGHEFGGKGTLGFALFTPSAIANS